MISRREFIKASLATGMVIVVSPNVAISSGIQRIPTPPEILANPLEVYLPDSVDIQLDIIDNLIDYLFEVIKQANLEDLKNALLFTLRTHTLAGAWFFERIIISKTDWRKYMIPVFNKYTGIKPHFSKEWKQDLAKIYIWRDNPETRKPQIQIDIKALQEKREARYIARGGTW